MMVLGLILHEDHLGELTVINYSHSYSYQCYQHTDTNNTMQLITIQIHRHQSYEGPGVYTIAKAWKHLVEK